MALNIRNREELMRYAVDQYKNSQCPSYEEFLDDFDRFTRIKKIISFGLNGREINYPLLLNHFRILLNVFSREAVKEILLLMTDKKGYSILKPILIFFKCMNINGSEPQAFDKKTLDFLRESKK